MRNQLACVAMLAILLIGACSRHDVRHTQREAPRHVASVMPSKVTPIPCSSAANLTPRSLILDALRYGPVFKGEFETTAQYTKRMNDLLTNLHTVTVAKRLGESDSFYNADRQELSIIFVSLLDHIFSDADQRAVYNGVIITQEDRNGGTYMGQNAFGVSKEISVYYHDSIDVAFRPKSSAKIGFEIKIRADAARALALKDSLCMVISGSPTAPFELRYTGTSAPTIDVPNEVHFHTVALLIGPVIGEIVDERSGTVLARFDPSMIE